LRLLPLRASDADEMFDVLNDSRLHEFTGGTPASLDDLRARYRSLAAGLSPDGSEAWLNWIIWAGERAIGFVQAGVMGGNANVAWVVGTPWQGSGYAVESAQAMVEWLVDRGITSITAFIHPDHAASAAVARHCGLSPTGELVGGEIRWQRLL
jgi:RimJ/RimL family protein N-acetyltransferase